MRINNLSKLDRDRIKSGDVKFLKKILEWEYEEIKEELVTFPLDKIQELRGKATELSVIIKLLP